MHALLQAEPYERCSSGCVPLTSDPLLVRRKGICRPYRACAGQQSANKISTQDRSLKGAPPVSYSVIEKGEAEMPSCLLHVTVLPPGAEADGKPIAHKQ